jgi:CHAD domain-containing protein
VIATAGIVSAQGARQFAREQAAHRLARVAFETKRVLDTAESSPASVDAVHDFRVSTRRFRAVLDTFGMFFPGRECERVRSKIRKAFRAAGDVRNRDIALELIAKAETPSGVLETALRDERVAYYRQLQEALRVWTRKDFSARWRERLNLP